MEPRPESALGGRGPLGYWRPVLAWAAIAYLGGLVAYGTLAWIERAAELWRGGNAGAAVSLVSIGVIASVLTPAVMVAVRLSRSKMLVRSAALYGLALSLFLMLLMTVTFNI